MLNAFRTQERSKKNIGKYLVHKKGLKKYWKTFFKIIILHTCNDVY